MHHNPAHWPLELCKQLHWPVDVPVWIANHKESPMSNFSKIVVTVGRLATGELQVAAGAESANDGELAGVAAAITDKFLVHEKPVMAPAELSEVLMAEPLKFDIDTSAADGKLDELLAKTAKLEAALDRHMPKPARKRAKSRK